MSVQLRCTNSLLRHLLFSKKQPLLFRFQGSSNIPPYSNNIRRSLLTTHNVKNKTAIPPTMTTKCNRSSKIWTEYQAKKSGSTSSLDIPYYNQLLTALAERAYRKPNNWKMIVKAYQDALSLNIKPSPTMYVAAMRAYGKCHDVKQVLAIYEDYDARYCVTAWAQLQYLKAVISTEDVHYSHRVFMDLCHNVHISHEQASACLALLVSLCVKKQYLSTALNATEHLLPYLEHWQPEAVTSIATSLQQGFGLDDFFDRKHLEEKHRMYIPSNLYLMFQLTKEISTPSITVCNFVLEQQLIDQHYGRVRSMLKTMRKLKLKADDETMDILIRYLGKPEVRKNVYSAYMQAIPHIENSKVILEEFKKRRELDTKALAWLLKTDCRDLDCYAILMEHWLLSGQWPEIMSTFDRLQTNHRDVNLNRRMVKAMLTASFAEGQDWSLCENLIKQLQIQFTSTTISRILHTLLHLENKSGTSRVPGIHIVRSLTILETNLDLQLSSDSLARIIRTLGNRGDIEDGYRLYNWVREQENNVRCADTAIYKALMFSATKNNDTRRLERAWVDMQYRKRFIDKYAAKIPHQLDAFNTLLNGYASLLPRPDLTRTKKVFSKLLQQGLAPNLVTYNILIKAFVNSNHMEAANQVYKQMIEEGTEPDSYTTNTILNGWIIRRDWHHVENFVQELKQSPQNCQRLDVVTFNLIVQSFLQLDSKTMQYTHYMKDRRMNTRLHEFEQGLNRPKMDSRTIWSIFESTTGYSQENVSNKVVEKNQDGFIKLFNTEPDAATFKLFMKAFVQIEDIKSAKSMLHWMKFRLNDQFDRVENTVIRDT